MAKVIKGTLYETYRQCFRGSMFHVDELLKERLLVYERERGVRLEYDCDEIHRTEFDTADGAVYCVDKKSVPQLYLLRERNNPILNRIDMAFGQLVFDGNYTVLRGQNHKYDNSTVRIDLTKLTLEEKDRERCFFRIDLDKNYLEYNTEEKKLLARVFTLDTYKDVMKLIREYHFENERYSSAERKTKAETGIYVLNPDYVMNQIQIPNRGIARATSIGGIHTLCTFDATKRTFSKKDCLYGSQYVGDKWRWEREFEDNYWGRLRDFPPQYTPPKEYKSKTTNLRLVKNNS